MIRLSEQWKVLTVVAIGTFMVVLDTTITNIALPKISAVFTATTDQSELVITGYLLALAIVMPATAFLSQRFGNKRAYLATLIGFTIGSALCAFAPNLNFLIGARVLQGVGGGMIQPLGMAMLFQVTPPAERGKVMGLFGLPLMVAPVLGPTLGGYLVEYVDWRWVFSLNVPIGALGVVLGVLLLRSEQARRGLTFDLPGFLLAATCLSAALLAATDAPKVDYAGWTDPRVLGLLAVSGVTLPLFVWWELRARQPILDVRLFAVLGFSLNALVSAAATFALYAALFLMPQFLQNPSLRNLGAWEAGLLLSWQALGMIPITVVAGSLYDRVGPRVPIIAGLLVLAGANWVLTNLDLTTSDSSLRLLLVVRGAGMGLAMIPSITAWLASVPPRRTSQASTFSSVLRQVYGSFATAIIASVLIQRQDFHYSGLAMTARLDLPGVTPLLDRALQAALAHGQGLVQARETVVFQLAKQAQLTAAVQSFDDCFRVLTMACLLAIVPALFLRRVGASGAGPVEI